MTISVARASGTSCGGLAVLLLLCLGSGGCAGSKAPAESTLSVSGLSPPATAVPSAPTPSPPEAMPSASNSPPVPATPSFADDLSFLERHGPVIVLSSPGGGRVAVSAKYQGRVMTSAVGAEAPSLGYINRPFILAGKTGTSFDNYGGEDRFWLGPEGGQYGLYFAPGKPFTFEHWRTPAGFQEGDWAVSERSPTQVVFTRHMKVSNFAGTELELEVHRTVRLIEEPALTTRVGTASLAGLRWVAYETSNRITNVGARAWTKDKGLPSVWILGMYNPSPDTFVVIPFLKGAQREIVNDRYFGKVPPERLRIFPEEGFLLFKCDGHHRSKIGLGPARAMEFAGSYSESSRLLTVVHYEKPKGPALYVNSMWEHQAEPYGGDVVNSYNDGPVEPGRPALGGFYEIETSSPAAALAPGASLTHVHRTLHFSGERAKLDPIARATLGVSLDRVADGG